MDEADDRFDIGRPHPHRHRVGLGLLWFAVAGAALAWALEHTAVYVLASHACSPSGSTEARLLEGWGWTSGALLSVTAFALALAAAATVAALVVLRRTGGRRRGAQGGLLQAGEGRSRYLATFGLWGGALFLIAMLGNLFVMLWLPACPG